MSIEKHKAFLNSLDGENGLPDQIKYAKLNLGRLSSFGKEADDMAQQVFDVLSSLESRQIPDLKEKVKELMRDAMDAAISYDCNYPWKTPDYETFRALCASEVKP